MAETKATGQTDWTTRNGLSREDELLIHCARLDLSQAKCDAIRELISGGLDWDLLWERAAWQRLSCLVSYHLRTPDLSAFVPQPMLKKLQQTYYFSLARNILLQDELSRFLSILDREGISAIVLKGAALLGIIYQDIALRPMGDLDILVKPEHLERAEAIALGQGYKYTVNPDHSESAMANTHQLPFLVHQEKRIVLEIHQYIVDANSPYHFELGGFWDRARPVSPGGTNYMTLAPEDQLLHLSIHFLYDRRFSSRSALGQLCDISELISYKGNSLNWDLVEKTIDKHHLGPGIHCVLYICKQLLGAQVPASVLAYLQPSEFNQSLVTLFIRRRVLDTKPWVTLDVMAKKTRYSYFRAFLGIIYKFFHLPRGMLQEYGSKGSTISFYFRLIKDLFPKLGRRLLRPTELKQDIVLDRWLHDIHRSSDGKTTDESDSRFDEARVP